MEIYILKENTLTDNTLMVASEGKIFKGGYVAIIEENAYQDAWSDKKTIKKYKSMASMEKYLAKTYPEFEF